MGDREQFGVRLRREREKRGISLESLAATTKVSVELWVGLERNDLSRWPSGIFARAFVRDYARAVGLDADAVVDEFCRQFPIADRRTTRIVEAQAELIGHTPERIEESEPLPAGRERRRGLRPSAPPPAAPVVYVPRLLAAGIDALFVCLLALLSGTLLGAGFLASAGALGVLYFTIGTIVRGTTPGVLIVAALRLRAPSLFTSRRAVNA